MREEQKKPMLLLILALMNSEKMITGHNMQSTTNECEVLPVGAYQC